MTFLVLGLILFLGTHSIRLVADGWRTAQVGRLGLNRWKGLYSLVSALGLGLIVAIYRRRLPIDVDELRELQG